MPPAETDRASLMTQAAQPCAERAEGMRAAVEGGCHVDSLRSRLLVVELLCQDCREQLRCLAHDDGSALAWQLQLEEAQAHLRMLHDALQAAGFDADAAMAEQAAACFQARALQERADAAVARALGGLPPPERTPQPRPTPPPARTTSAKSSDRGDGGGVGEGVSPSPPGAGTGDGGGVASSSRGRGPAAAALDDRPALTRQHLQQARQEQRLAVVDVPAFRVGAAKLAGWLPKRDPGGKGKEAAHDPGLLSNQRWVLAPPWRAGRPNGEQGPAHCEPSP